MEAPSGPVVTTEVTEPLGAAVTCVPRLPCAVVVIPLSIMSDMDVWDVGVELGGGIGPSCGWLLGSNGLPVGGIFGGPMEGGGPMPK